MIYENKSPSVAMDTIRHPLKTAFVFLAFCVFEYGGMTAWGNGGWLHRPWDEASLEAIPRFPMPDLVRSVDAIPASAGWAERGKTMLSDGRGLARDVVPFTSAGLSGRLAPGNDSYIQTLAAGLDHDWKRCFDFVRNHIAYSPYPGIVKGPERTFLDREGNDADQAFLLCALLRESGYDSATVLHMPMVASSSFESGFLLPVYDLDGKTPCNALAWMGASSRSELAAKLESSQVKTCWVGDGYISFEHYWVALNLDNETIHLDPAIKPQKSRAARNAVAASGYDRESLLSAAAGTVGPDSVRSLSIQGVSAYLAACVADLKAAWTAPGSSPKTVLGELEITPCMSGDSRFPGQLSGDSSPVDLLAAPGETLNALRVPLRLSCPDGSLAWANGNTGDVFFYLDEIGSRTLWFSHEADHLVLHDGDSILANGTANGGIGSVKVSVDYSAAPSVHTYSLGSGTGLDVNVLVVGLGGHNGDGILKETSKLIAGLKGKGCSDAEGRMKAALLQLQGQQWLSQVTTFTRLWNRVVGGNLGLYYMVGISGQTSGPFVDMGNVFTKGYGGHGLVGSDLLFRSALEHSVIEQLNGKTNQAVSTVKVLFCANERGIPIYHVSSNNMATVLSSLSGYPDSEKNAFSFGTANGNMYLLPQNGNLSVNRWQGTGYIECGYVGEINAVHTSMIISGGLNGGYSTVEKELDSASYEEQSLNQGNWQDASIRQSTHADPVSMPSGAYLDSVMDLAILRATPLAWERSYDTRSAGTVGDLGRGWSHAFEADIVETSDAFALLGSASLDAVLPTVVAIVAAEDLMAESGTDGLSAGEIARYWTLAAIVADWWAEQLPQTCVTVKTGAQTLSFQKMPDGSYAPAPGVKATLTRESNGGYRLQERLGNAFIFNSDRKLASIVDPSGNATTLIYAGGKLEKIANDFGASMKIDRNGDGQITCVTDNSGKSVAYAYDTNVCMTEAIDAAGGVWSYAYDSASHRMVAKKNPAGDLLIQNTYSQSGQVTNQIASNGETWRFGYVANSEAWNEDPLGGRFTETFDASGRSLSRTLRDGATFKTDYDGHGNIATTSDPLGNRGRFSYDERDNLRVYNEGSGMLARSTRFGHDAQDRLVAVTNALEEATYYEHDACHRVTKATAADGTFIQNDWNANGTLAEKRRCDAAGRVLLRTTYAYGTYGLPTSRTVFGDGLPEKGIVTTTEYTADGRPAAVTDAMGHRSTFAYDPAGRLIAVTDALGNTDAFAYDAAGRIVAVTDALGHTTRTAYNASGLPVANTNPDGTMTGIVYDEVEEILETIDERGARTTFERDAEGRPVAVMDALENVARSRYDVLGRSVWSQDASGVESWMEYDAFSRPVETRNALGEVRTVSFDKLDRPVSTTSPLGQTTRAEYDKVGHLVRSVRASGAVESFGYDAAGNQVAYTNSEGHVYRMAYDALGHMLAATNALGERVATMTYDSNGNLSRVEDGNGTVRTFEYDALDRLMRRTSPDGTDTFNYDADGNLVGAENATAQEAFEYDSRNRLVAASTTVGGVSVRQAWQRDPGGLVTNLVYGTELSVAHRYDAAGRLVAVDAGNGWVWTFAWDGAGRLVRMTSPDGRESLRAYDAAGRLVSWNAGELAGRAIEYDAAGRKTCDHVTAGAMPSPAVAHHVENAFDAADRLVTSSVEMSDGSTRTESFAYDGNGALVRVESGGESVNFHYNANLALDGITLDGVETAFAYDAIGNRVVARGHVWIPDQTDALRRPLLEFDADGALLRSYIWVAGMLLGFVDADESLVVAHADEQGGVIALSREDGTILHTAFYGPHGEDWGCTGVNLTPFAWLGGFGVQNFRKDSLLGDFYFTRYRLYSSAQQRFLSSDPMGLAGGLNLYAYGNGNAVMYVDPLGLCGGNGQSFSAGLFGFGNGVNQSSDFLDVMSDASAKYYRSKSAAEYWSGEALYLQGMKEGNYAKAETGWATIKASEASKGRAQGFQKLGTGAKNFSGGVGFATGTYEIYTAEDKWGKTAEVGSGNIGAWVGAELGGEIGAAIGTAFLPGIGTAVGGVVGGIVGGVAGSEAGRASGKWLYEQSQKVQDWYYEDTKFGQAQDKVERKIHEALYDARYQDAILSDDMQQKIDYYRSTGQLK